MTDKLRNKINILAKDGHLNTSDVYAIQLALTRREGQKPLHVSGNRYMCPNYMCSAMIEDVEELFAPNYCRYCGQKLDWEGSINEQF